MKRRRMQVPPLAPVLAGLVCAGVASAWLAAPQFLVDLLDIHRAVLADVLGRRVGMLLLALGGVLFAAASSRSTRSVVVGVAAAGCAGLAVLGTAELLVGNVGPGILIAVGTETALAAALAAWAARRREPPGIPGEGTG